MQGLPPVINTSILVEAKKEYTKHVCNLLASIIMDGLQTIYDNCRQDCEQNQDPEILRAFQKTLKQIPKWNQDIIDKEYDRIMDHENCDILDDLVKAVFITNIKILSSVTSSVKPKTVRIEIPSSKRFIHKCYIESAREIYKDPFLFTHDVSPIEHHRNLKEIYDIVCDGIEEAIRILLPVRQILQEYLGEALMHEEEESIDGVISDTMKQNLQKMVQQEIENFRNINNPPTALNADVEQPISGIGQLVNDIPTPPRSPKTPRAQSPLFPNKKDIGNITPSPLMQMLGTKVRPDSPLPENRTSDVKEIQNAIKQLTPKYRSRSRSRSPVSRSRSRSSESIEMDIRPLSSVGVGGGGVDEEGDDERSGQHTRLTALKTFRVDPRNRHKSVPAHRKPSSEDSDDNDDRNKNQNDIKAIVLGQTKRDRGRGKYERDYHNPSRDSNNFPLKDNKYRRKSLQFTIEDRTDSDDDYPSLKKAKKRKNLFFDSSEEDFAMK